MFYPTLTYTVVAFWIVGLVAFLALLAIFFTVEHRTAVIVQRFGKFLREAKPGLHARIPFVDTVAGRINLRVQQLDVRIETKTEDDVFVHLVVAVQYFVLPDKAYDAFYWLDNPRRQIRAYVNDIVRNRVLQTQLDDIYAKRDGIADLVKAELTKRMDGFGYGIREVLVTDIDPNRRVKQAMNEINAAQRVRVAATEIASSQDKGTTPTNGSTEANRILEVSKGRPENLPVFANGQ